MFESSISDHLIDAHWDDKSTQQIIRQVRQRLTIPAPSGLLWFLNVTLGFYLPQIMARNWGKALPHGAPVKSRMSGNGWDLHHAATNAIRIADDKQEIFSFGMLFLDPTAYRRALEVPSKWRELRAKKFRKLIEGRETDAPSEEHMWRRHLLLRIWSCCGYSNGRYWSAFSLWRGLGFIGQVLELGVRHEKVIRKCSKHWPDLQKILNEKENSSDSLFEHFDGKIQDDTQEKLILRQEVLALQEDLFRLIRTHGLQGLVPGFLLSEDTNDVRLLHGFLKWEPRVGDIEPQIQSLAKDLIAWLAANWNDSNSSLTCRRYLAGLERLLHKKGSWRVYPWGTVAETEFRLSRRA